MANIGKIKLDRGILLAPMEAVTDISFRVICKRMGADIVYTEFVNAEGLIRNVKKTKKKLALEEEERPVGIQIYGGEIESMVEAARIAEQENPDLIDLNCGCWVKKIASRGAGAGLLKDPPLMARMAKAIIDEVSVPVTVKTRIGWDAGSINIVEVAKLLEQTGVAALTIHCRTRSQGHSGEAQLEHLESVKKAVSIPVIGNGGILQPEDARRMFETGCDAVMIARGAIANPWIFKQTKHFLRHGSHLSEPSLDERVDVVREHLRMSVLVKGERKAILEFRKYYSGYLKGIPFAARVRADLMKLETLDTVLERIDRFRDETRQATQNEFVVSEPLASVPA